MMERCIEDRGNGTRGQAEMPHKDRCATMHGGKGQINGAGGVGGQKVGFLCE